MKKAIIFSSMVLAVVLGFSSCKSEKNCDVLATSDVLTEQTQVTYTITLSGDATCSSVTIATNHGDSTISNPGNIWFTSVVLDAGKHASIAAHGTTKKGSINAAYSGFTGSTDVEGSDECSQQ